MTPPSIAILDKNGVIFTKKRNYSALTIERDLYNYLESQKNKSMKRMFFDISKQAMFQVYYSAYFLENSKFVKLLAHPLLTFGMYFLRFMVGVKFLMRKVK